MEQILQEQVAAARDAIARADAVVIGAGAGLSAAAGLTYSGTRFETFFKAYKDHYGMTDMYSAGFYPFPDLESKWGYWVKHIYHNRYQTPSLPLYQALMDLVADKDYFVITTNVDGQFQKAGVVKERFFEVQGNYGQWQCSVPCSDTLYDNEAAVKALLPQIRDLKIPSDQVPHCPKCGAPLVNHLRVDDSFVENADWQAAQQAYVDFLSAHAEDKLVLLELGVGFNTPSIIRFPFERLAQSLPQTQLIRVNREEDGLPRPASDKIVTLDAGIEEVIGQWQAI